MRSKSQIIFLHIFSSTQKIIFLSLLITSCTFLKIAEKPKGNNVVKAYFPNGNIEYEAEYLNGKLDGITRTWSEDGIISSESIYNNNQPHGMWKKFHRSGSIMYETKYEYGKKHGFEKWFYENGQVKSEQHFIHGQSKGGITRWESDGSLIY